MQRRLAVVVPLLMGAAVVTLPVLAQQPRGAGPFRIALVPELTPASGLQEFVGFLRDTGRMEGRDFVLLRSGFQYGQPWEAMIKLAVEARPDLIVAGNTALARAYQKLLPNTPIVLSGGGLPLEGGLVDSLARPGRNVTGVSFYADKALFGKYLQLLREAKPSIRRVGVLWSQVPPLFLREEIEQAFAQFRNDAIRLRLDVHIMEVGTPEDVDAAMRSVGSEGIDALVLTVGRALILRSKQVMDFTAQKHLPALTDLKWDWVDPRPLLCYGATLQAMARQAAGYVDRILWGGARPGDLPMQQPTKFELVVNLRTAKMIGITIPQSLLLRADEVIQ